MRTLAKETLAKTAACVAEHKAKRDAPAIIYADGTVPCLECGGTGFYPKSGESCYACTNGVVEVLREVDAEDVR